MRSMTQLPAQLDLSAVHNFTFAGLESLDQGVRDAIKSRFEWLVQTFTDQAREEFRAACLFKVTAIVASLCSSF